MVFDFKRVLATGIGTVWSKHHRPETRAKEEATSSRPFQTMNTTSPHPTADGYQHMS